MLINVLIISLSLYRLYLRLRGRRKIILKEESDLTYQTTTDCNKFIRHHLIQCSKDIVTNLRYTSVNDLAAFLHVLIQINLMPTFF